MILSRWSSYVAAIVTSAVAAQAAAQAVQQDDLIVGVDSITTDSIRHVRAAGGAVPGVTPLGGASLSIPSPWSQGPLQSVEFDNAGGISHNASGNLLALEFGNGFQGVEIFNLATDGSGAVESLWGIAEATGGVPGTAPVDPGVRIERGSGLSVNPSNTRIAWANFDNGQLNVMEYDAGATPGAGSGASITGWLETSEEIRDGLGVPRTPLDATETQGTAWLDDDTVIAFSGRGELLAWFVSGQTSSSTAAPTSSSTWAVLRSNVFAASSASFVDIEYNATIAPDYIIGSMALFSAQGAASEVVVLDATTLAVVDRVDLSDSFDTFGESLLREIALDSNGNLYIGSFGGEVGVIADFIDNVGSIADNSSVTWFQNDFVTSFSGLDVAASVPMVPEPSGVVLVAVVGLSSGARRVG